MSRARAFSLPLVLVALVACSSERKAPGESNVPAERKAPGAPTAPPGLEVTLPRQPFRVGEQELKVSEMRMDLRLEVQGQALMVVATERTEELLKVLAADGFAVTEAEVTYKSIVATNEVGGQQETKPDPRAGKSYRVARDNGVVVARALGGAASDEELEEVVDDHDEIGVPSEIDAIIASKTWKAGQPIAFTRDELARVNAQKQPRPGEDKETVTAMELTLRSQREGVVVFALTMGMRIEDDRGHADFTVKGEAHVDASTGRLLEIGGTGTIAGAIQGVPAEGSLTMKVASRWVTAP